MTKRPHSLRLIAVPGLLAALAFVLFTSLRHQDSEPTPHRTSVASPAPAALAAIPKAHAWERAQWHVQRRLSPGQAELPMDYLERARVQASQLKRGTSAARYRPKAARKAPASWVSLGPDQKGGRTRRVVFDSDGRMLASGVSGGVWAYENNRWRALGDSLANVNVGALAVAPGNNAVIYAGTGELYRRTNRPYSNMTGAGIFKSTNGGEDWVQLDATINDNFLYVSDIVVSALSDQRIYAATNTGIWRSDDGGVTFTATLSTAEGSQQRFEGCTDLELRPDTGTDWVVATCSSRSEDDRYFLPGLLPDTCGGPCDARIYLNAQAEASDSWQITLTEPGMGRTSIAAWSGDSSVMYALASSTVPGPDKNDDGVGDYDNGLHALFRSDNGGQSWTATLRNSDDDPVSTWMLAFAWQARTDGNTPYNAGWYNQAVAVDPSSADVVWVGGMQLYRSDDGGRTFGLTSNYFSDSNTPATDGPEMHPDIHALTFDADGTLWIGNDGGVWRAWDRLAPSDRLRDGYRSLMTQGTRFTEQVRGYTTTQFYHGSVSPDGAMVFGGMQDNGSDVFNHPQFPNQWVTFLGGDGSYTAYNARDDLLYLSAQRGQIFRVDANLEYQGLADALYQPVQRSDEFMFITPFVLDPQNPSTIFVAGKRLYRGTFDGLVFDQASAEFGRSFYDKGNAIALAPVRPWALVGTGNAIYRIVPTMASSSVTVPDSTQPRTGWVSSLAFDPNDDNTAYATYSSLGGDHVFKSTDGGLSFFSIDGAGADRLPDVPVHSIAVHPTDRDTLYVGTDLGVFFTLDGGQSWQVEETGFGGAIVERLVINEPEGSGTAYLFAFTYGRGVWRVPLADVDGEPAYRISEAVNGLWYDTQEPGHGIQVQLINGPEGPRLLTTWYVYRDGEPMWLIGVGDIRRDRAVIPMTLTSGADFGAAFDAAAVQREDWGQLELVFESGSALSFRWLSGAGAGQAGTLKMGRLTVPQAISVAGAPMSYCSTGVYYNPAQDGHGIVAETILQNGQPALAWSWFHYLDGRQLWLVGSAPFDGNRVVSEAFSGVSGEFPPKFDSDTTQVDSWGTVTFEFDQEQRFTASWSASGSQIAPGSVQMTPLTTLADARCNP